MATISDRLEAYPPEPGARSERIGSVGPGAQGGLDGMTSGIAQRVRSRPLTALGLSLVAGSLLQDFLSGGQRGTSGSQATSGATGSARSALSGATDTVGGTAQSAGERVAGAAEQTVSTAADAARQAADTATDTARSAAETTADAARRVADTTGDAMGDLGGTVREQVQQRPLTAVGVAVGAGALLQPTLSPQVSSVTQSIRDQSGRLTGSLSGATTSSSRLANQAEVDRIREALVPATVERAKRFASRDMREYLDSNLEGLIGQTSLRAGVVAAVTEKTEEVTESRLPNLLDRNLSGARGLLIMGIAAALLKARDEARQGQGNTFGNVGSDLGQSVTQSSKEQLQRHFPEFRERYQSSGGASTVQ